MRGENVGPTDITYLVPRCFVHVYSLLRQDWRSNVIVLFCHSVCHAVVL